MTKTLSKRYVLVDEDVYERKFNDERAAESRKRYNPFTNPAVVDTKRTREDIARVANDGGGDAADVHEASLALQRLVQRYADVFAKATSKGGKNKRSKEKLADVTASGDAVPSPSPGVASRKSRGEDEPSPPPPDTPGKPLTAETSASSPKLVVPLTRLTPRGAARVRFSPVTGLQKKVSDSISAETVASALGGGYLNDEDREKAKRVLAQMRDSGLTTDSFQIKSIDDDGLSMNARRVKTAIRDMITAAPGQRKTDDQTVRQLADYLRKKRVKVSVR